MAPVDWFVGLYSLRWTGLVIRYPHRTGIYSRWEEVDCILNVWEENEIAKMQNEVGRG